MAQSSVDFERTVALKSDMTVQTICEGCYQSFVVDTSPLFGTMGPTEGVYLARATERCLSAQCKPKKGKKTRTVNLIPVDKTMKFIGRKSFRALVNKAKKEETAD